jgi:hypothetical protein
MFAEIIHLEVWRKKLEQSGYRVILEPFYLTKEEPKKTGAKK